MDDIKSKRRRDLLIGAGAILANTSVLGRSAIAQPAVAASSLANHVKNHRGKRRLWASIVPDLKNPYFNAQGRPSASLTANASAAATTMLARSATVHGAAASAAATSTSTLVLYDTTGPYGWLGELYAIMTLNLASHFGSWTAMPVVSYSAGLLSQHTACVYIGSTYGEPLPAAFLSDVYSSTTNVIWIFDNIWQLTGANPGFATKYGFAPWVFDYSTVATVTYKSQSLKRYSANAAGIMSYSSVGANATILAECVRSDNSTFPWAVRSGNLTYIGENPFAYISEGDRYLIFCDLLFDALAPATVTQHRALVRLEDIDPTADATALRSTANWLYENKVPFGFQIIARYLDPNGYYNGGIPVDISMHTETAVVSAIKYMQERGGTMICHGYTHQYSNVDNPYTGVTGDDCEFYQLAASNGTLTYVGQLPPDTGSAWALGRFASYASEIAACGLAMPTLVTFPAYAASVPDYQAATATFATRTERSLYFTGLLSNQAIDYQRLAGQYFPYTVHDVYGSKVLADSLGGIDPTTYFSIPPRLPADIIADSQRTLVVRDGYASFFYNTEDSISYLQQTVAGIKALGYTFVSPTSA
jgi:uncharacterized protein YdaL